MCTLYSQVKAREEILRLFRITDNQAEAVKPSPAIFPSNTAPVIRIADDGERELVNLSWGFPLLQLGKAPRRVVNFRDDKLDIPFWRDSFELRRCLVPVTSFAEPLGERPAKWHWFALKGAEPRPLFSFAGIWRRYRARSKRMVSRLSLTCTQS